MILNKGKMRKIEKTWFMGLICLCLVSDIWVAKSEAVSKGVKTKIVYGFGFVDKFGDYEPELIFKTIYEYDSEGNEIKETYSYRGSIMSIRTYKYDENGNKIAKETKGSYRDKLDRETYKYKYDDNGNKIEMISYDENGELISKWIYKYDDNGNEIEAIHHGTEFGVPFSVKYTSMYDENGNRIERILCNTNGKLIRRWTYEYDEKGRKIRENYFDLLSEVKTKTTTIYENENKIEEIIYDSNGELKNKYIYEYKYDKKGNETEEIKYECKFISGDIKKIPKYKLVYEYYTEENKEIILREKEPKASRYTFRKTTWGMSKEQIKNTEAGKISYDTEKMLIYKGSIAGLDCNIVYIFAEGKLVRTKYLITEEHSNKNAYISDYNSLKESLTRKYGQPIIDEHVWSRDLYKDDPQRWGFAISRGDLSYYAAWGTLQTSIVLVLYGDNYDITLGIEYKSKQLKELEEREKEKKLLEEF